MAGSNLGRKKRGPGYEFGLAPGMIQHQSGQAIIHKHFRVYTPIRYKYESACVMTCLGTFYDKMVYKRVN